MPTDVPQRTPASRFGDDAGIAMVSVIAITAVLTLIAVTAISFTLNAQRYSRNHQDWNAALAAAEAGVDDFVARLNRDRQYFDRYETDLDGDGRNLNPAIDRWAQLPGTAAWYHYGIDATEVLETGAVTVASTGRVGAETRTVQVRVRPESFFDWIYFTDYEVVDPRIIGPADGQGCDRRFDETPGRVSGCVNLRFISADVLLGPVHSNDALQIEGNPTFLGPTTTSFNEPTGGHVDFVSRAIVPPQDPDDRFVRDGDPAWDEEKTFPPTNDSILGDAENHGCVYHGPTYIHLQGETMTVRSPLSDNPKAGSPVTTADCANGDPADLDAFTANVDIPPVIYVNEAADCGPYTNSTSPPNHPLGLDRREETRSDLRYDCRFGDVFVWGELDTQLTIAASNNINIIWDLIYQDGVWQEGNNILGLVADNFVQVRMPRTNDDGADRPVARRAPFPADQPAGTSDGQLWEDPEIHGAILSLERSFRVQNHGRISPLGTLSVYGSIAQKFRGPVGTGSATTPVTGFIKDYRYDQRLRFISPPYFIDPVEARYVVRGWAEVRTAVGHPDGLPDFPDG